MNEVQNLQYYNSLKFIDHTSISGFDIGNNWKVCNIAQDNKKDLIIEQIIIFIYSYKK